MKHPTEVFDEWAISGKDKGMETSHAVSVSEILKYALARIDTDNNQFTFLDIGCGNGWVATQLSEKENCILSVGIDAAENMILNANKRQSKAVFFLKDINDIEVEDKFDLIFSMEVLYYLENPSDFIKTIYRKWLNSSGCFIFGIDHYLENKPSINWPKDFSVNMNTQSIEFWINSMKAAGFNNIQYWQSGAKDEWVGTLVIFGEK